MFVAFQEKDFKRNASIRMDGNVMDKVSTLLQTHPSHTLSAQNPKGLELALYPGG